MAFIVYRWNKDNEGFRRFEYEQEVSLAGKNGPIALHVNDIPKKEGIKELHWHLTEDEILSRLGKTSHRHALVVDLKPTVENNVSLYQLKEIWGFSYEVWTPIAVRLETIFVDKSHLDPKEFKQRFDDKECVRVPVYEFLYLQGGIDGGFWSWGPVGSINGALLWPDALDYFIGVLSDSLRNLKAI
jgi:hypothetical protein